MQLSRARQPIAAAAGSLLCFAAGVGAFLPPFNHYVLDFIPLIVLTGLAIAVSLVLHLVFIGIAASRLGRSATRWVIIAVVGFPIASIVGLILFEWFSEEQDAEQKMT
jgi:hypothetical protein